MLEGTAGLHDRINFNMVVAFESDQPLKQADYYLDYPFDFMEFVGATASGQQITGDGWTLYCEQPGYARLSFSRGTSAASIPARTVSTKDELMSMGP